MTEQQFYDWQTLGGTDDVMRFVNALESADATVVLDDGKPAGIVTRQDLLGFLSGR